MTAGFSRVVLMMPITVLLTIILISELAFSGGRHQHLSKSHYFLKRELSSIAFPISLQVLTCNRRLPPPPPPLFFLATITLDKSQSCQ
jgi:hypothetical protein